VTIVALLRYTYGQFGDFDIQHGKRLIDPDSTSVSSSSVINCTRICFNDNTCISFNFQIGGRGKESVCEMINVGSNNGIMENDLSFVHGKGKFAPERARLEKKQITRIMPPTNESEFNFLSVSKAN
jgi:hypothetical protein